ncbi:uncharacterized protein BO97DRAFT_72067 [Aspergillus homomorphus CBS 101889]|uniref:Uncharacterized protein n=1 Tax=Aspergillus homomorphus (strain CBS 101889) TaxID=1450537 RepID=A0A395IC27_ASPHC|nr:hypothetical protein BO97DRAFT_72067 [Aspergillus homomorphus CBS 101889]RAL16648.1 hypothetical protein BO97DRAFT_72067 [Aspergillus homomorphus CBS 101889]
MCGPSRPSTGSLIAIIFPSPDKPSTSNTSYSLSFSHNTPEGPTKATFRITDPKTRDIFRAARGVDLRIEKYGDLTAHNGEPPLHWFRIPLSEAQSMARTRQECEEIELRLPERLELGVSGTGIVGREVRISVEGVDERVEMGRGVVGFD